MKRVLFTMMMMVLVRAGNVRAYEYDNSDRVILASGQSVSQVIKAIAQYKAVENDRRKWETVEAVRQQSENQSYRQGQNTIYGVPVGEQNGQKEIRQLRQENEDLKQSLRDMQEKFKEMQKSFGELQKQHEETEKQNEKLRQEVGNLLTKIDNLVLTLQSSKTPTPPQATQPQSK